MLLLLQEWSQGNILLVEKASKEILTRNQKDNQNKDPKEKAVTNIANAIALSHNQGQLLYQCIAHLILERRSTYAITRAVS
jgi:adenylate kinase